MQIALEEIYSSPAIAKACFDLDIYLDQPFLPAVASDPRIQNALKEYQVEKSQAAKEVAAYLDGLDSC